MFRKNGQDFAFLLLGIFTRVTCLIAQSSGMEYSTSIVCLARSMPSSKVTIEHKYLFTMCNVYCVSRTNGTMASVCRYFQF